MLKTITKQRYLFMSLLAVVALTIASCSSDNRDDLPTPEHDHDEVTKLELKITGTGSSSSFTETITYIIPEGSTTPNLQDISLPGPGTYNVEAYFYSPHDDHFDPMNDVIFGTEADEHFVFFEKVGATGINIAYADDDAKDSQENKLGFKTNWTIDAGATGQVYLYLIHEPASKNPDAPNRAALFGSTDFEARFKVVLP